MICKNGNIAPLPTFSVLSPSACFNRNTTSKHFKGMFPQSDGNLLEAVEGVGEHCAAEKGENDGHLVA